MAAAFVLLNQMAGLATKLWPLVPVALFVLGPRRCLARLGPLVQVSLAVLAIQIGFLFMKSAIPQLMPFWADPLFARADQLLLFGQDAWTIAHRMTPDALAAYFPAIYMPLWIIAASALPIIVVATDPNPERIGRYVWLFLGVWVVVGNIAATLGSSVGPIYYDRLLDTARFADLHAALAATGLSDGPIGQLQARLWAAKGDIGGIRASGISAFPSVHVAIAALTALYLTDRFWGLGALLGAAFLGLRWTDCAPLRPCRGIMQQAPAR